MPQAFWFSVILIFIILKHHPFKGSRALESNPLSPPLKNQKSCILILNQSNRMANLPIEVGSVLILFNLLSDWLNNLYLRSTIEN